MLLKTFNYTFKLIYKSSRLLFAVYFLLQLACSVTPLWSTYILKEILDCLVASESVWRLVGVYVGSVVLLLILQSAQTVCYNTITKKAEHQYACELAAKMDKMPLSFIDTSRGKNMIDEVQNLKTSVVNMPNYVIQTTTFFFTFIVAFVKLASFNWGFSLIFLALTIPGLFSQLHFRKKADALRRKQAPDVRRFCYYRWMLTDERPAKDVRTYDLTEPLMKRYDEEKTAYLDANKKLDKKRMFAALITEFVMRSGEIVFSFFVVIKAVTGYISVGDVSLYIGFAVAATMAFQRMVGAILYGIVRSVANMKYVFEFYETETPLISDGKRELSRFESLAFDNVFFRYPTSEKYVLNGVSFTLNRGDKLSIVGINGAGKTTIIKLMLGLYEIESGRILVNGYPVSDYDMRDIRHIFSVFFQSFVQYPLTLRENVALSNLEKLGNDSEIEDALRQSSVYDELQPKLENGLDSWMTRKFDDHGTELSKGQWQKIALSRAYFKDAPIIIFDEPSAALDAEAEDRIFKNFEEMSDGKTGVMISHRISSSRISNKIIVLDGGRIVEQGTHDELVSSDGLYAKLYNLQKEKYTLGKGGEPA